MTFNLFVYGTLMSGFRANSMLGDVLPMKASISGRLYHYTCYPIVVLDKDPSYIEGSLDYYKDVEIQEHYPVPDQYEPKHPIIGELYHLPLDKEVISRLDFYEGFTGSESTYYKRTLVPVKTLGAVERAWVYNMAALPYGVIPVYDGDWRKFLENQTNV